VCIRDGREIIAVIMPDPESEFDSHMVIIPGRKLRE